MAILKIKDGNEWKEVEAIKGNDGISPIVTTSKSGRETTITIVDAEGTKTVTILDGKDGSGVDEKVFYCECSTSGNSQNKIINIDEAIPNEEGVVLFIHFQNSQQYNGLVRLEFVKNSTTIGTYNTNVSQVNAWKDDETICFVNNGGDTYEMIKHKKEDALSVQEIEKILYLD